MSRPPFLPRLPLRPRPALLPALALVHALNHCMRGQGMTPALEELHGKHVRLCLTDLPLALDVRVTRSGLRLGEDGARPDVTIRGTLADFWRLASRAEDPDTLFFTRRLCLEGETETGLLIKNALDALDWDLEAHVRDVLPPPLASAAVGVARRIRALHHAR